MGTFESTGWQRWGTVTGTTSAPSASAATVPSGLIVTEGYRGIRLRVFGDTDGDTCSVDIYSVDRASLRTGSDATSLFTCLKMFDLDTWTVGDGTTKGVATSTGILTDTEYFADTVSAPAVSTWGQYILDYVSGSIDEYSPTGNSIAEVYISDIGNIYGIVPVFSAVSDDYAGLMFKLDT